MKSSQPNNSHIYYRLWSEDFHSPNVGVRVWSILQYQITKTYVNLIYLSKQINPIGATRCELNNCSTLEWQFELARQLEWILLLYRWNVAETVAAGVCKNICQMLINKMSMSCALPLIFIGTAYPNKYTHIYFVFGHHWNVYRVDDVLNIRQPFWQLQVPPSGNFTCTEANALLFQYQESHI